MGSELHILRCLAILLAATYHMPVAYTNLWQTKNVPKYFESPPPNSRGARSSISENSRILDKWITEYVLFCDHFFCLVQSLGFIPVVHLGFSFFIVWMYRSCLSIHLLMGIGIVFNVGAVWIRHLWISVYRSVGTYVFTSFK